MSTQKSRQKTRISRRISTSQRKHTAIELVIAEKLIPKTGTTVKVAPHQQLSLQNAGQLYSPSNPAFLYPAIPE
jgi:hypothetical protein